LDHWSSGLYFVRMAVSFVMSASKFEFPAPLVVWVRLILAAIEWWISPSHQGYHDTFWHRTSALLLR